MGFSPRRAQRGKGLRGRAQRKEIVGNRRGVRGAAYGIGDSAVWGSPVWAWPGRNRNVSFTEATSSANIRPRTGATFGFRTRGPDAHPGRARGRESTVEERQVTAVATRLKLLNWLQLRRFFRVNGAIERQLKDTSGLISYRLHADFLRLRFSTLSVWEDDRAVDAFVKSGSHREAMARFDEMAVRDESSFVRWNTADPQGITWDEGSRRLAGVFSTEGGAMGEGTDGVNQDSRD